MRLMYLPGQTRPNFVAQPDDQVRHLRGRTPDALVTDDLIEFHRAHAAGGVGMTTVAYCAVSPGGRTDGKQI